jgi:hypothetical protein
MLFSIYRSECDSQINGAGAPSSLGILNVDELYSIPK